MDTPTTTRLCALLTCHNRRDKTLACLHALERAFARAGLDAHAVLVDDGSRDGTASAVRQQFRWVQVVPRDGQLYWCRGMHEAFEIALHQGYDHYLWLNDDTLLAPDALAQLLHCEAELRQGNGADVIVVGSTVDGATGQVNYGGERRRSWLNPLSFARIAPSPQPQRSDSLTGNIVLISDRVAHRVGNLDPAFEHAMGDTDYGLRAQAQDVQVWVAPGTHGACSSNPTVGTYRDPRLPLARRWRLMLDRKGLPWRSWLRFTLRHAGWRWPLLFVWPYARFGVEGLLRIGRTE